MYKIAIFKDQEDIDIKLTQDKIINVTGMIGSGKSTYVNQYREKDDFIVISIDYVISGLDRKNRNEASDDLIKHLSIKFPELEKVERNNNKMFDDLLLINKEKFKKYYKEMILFFSTDSYASKTIVFDGQHLYRYLDVSDMKGKLIVKRTSLFNCWKRSILRQIYRNKEKLRRKDINYKEYIIYIYKTVIRRTKQLKFYKDMNNFLNTININRKQ